jgi:hypothetical protein
MRAFVILGVSLLAATAYAERPHFISPDQQFEAYQTDNAADGTGAKLFLRRAKSRETGVLVFENMRWIDAKWSPDSRFLAVVDHNDGHIADVYVFGVRAAAAAQPQITLYYHTPDANTYGVRWDVIGWRLSNRSIVLDKEVSDPNAKKPRYHRKIVAHIGETPLPLPNET